MWNIYTHIWHFEDLCLTASTDHADRVHDNLFTAPCVPVLFLPPLYPVLILFINVTWDQHFPFVMLCLF